MANLDTAIIAHMDVSGKHFEIYVDPDLGYMYRTGKKPELNNVLIVEDVFENAKKGERHTAPELMKAFGTTDIFKIADIILKKGEIQLTTEQKRKMTEERRKQIIAILMREAIDPRTGAPHTQIRLEQSLEQARVKIDPFKEAEQQLEDVLKELRPIIPLKFEKVRIAVKISPEYAQRIYGTLKNYGMQREEWAPSGHLIAVFEISAGIQSEFYDKINKLTAGSAETKILK